MLSAIVIQYAASMKQERRQHGLNNMLNYVYAAAYILAFATLPAMAQVAPAQESAVSLVETLAGSVSHSDQGDVENDTAETAAVNALSAAKIAAAEAATAAVEAAEIAAAEAAEAAQARLVARQSLQERIDFLATESGPYAASLIEVHFDLGSLYQIENLHEEAAASFADALQLVRISEGLYSERQIVVLEQLISVNKAAENWTGADNNHHLLFQIKKQRYQNTKRKSGKSVDLPNLAVSSQINSRSIENNMVDNNAWAAAVIEFGEWKLYASRANLLRRSSTIYAHEIEEVHELYSDAIEEISEIVFSTDSDGASSVESDADLSAGIPALAAADKGSLVSLLYGKAQAEYEIAQTLMRMPLDSFAGQGSPYTVRTVCFPVAAGRTPQHNTQASLFKAAYEPGSGAGEFGNASFKVTENGSSPNLVLAQADTTGAVRRVCTSERIENPAYRASQRNEQRMRLDRAAMNMRATIQDLHAILESGISDNSVAQGHQERLTELNQMQQALVRDSRRNISRWAW